MSRTRRHRQRRRQRPIEGEAWPDTKDWPDVIPGAWPEAPVRAEPPPDPAPDKLEDRVTQPHQRQTWWQRHAISVMGVFSLVMLVVVITVQMSC